MKKRYGIEEVVIEISKLPVEEFLGVCRILGVSLAVDGEETTKIFNEVIDKVAGLTRTQRKNLLRILRAANEDR